MAADPVLLLEAWSPQTWKWKTIVSNLRSWPWSAPEDLENREKIAWAFLELLWRGQDVDKAVYRGVELTEAIPHNSAD